MAESVFDDMPPGDRIITVGDDGRLPLLVVSSRPDLLPPELLLNNIVHLPDRALLSCVVNRLDAYDDGVKVTMDRLGAQLLAKKQQECGKEIECEARASSSEHEVPEISGKVYAVGILCGRACVDCPLDLRDVL
jgi:hypothetical protein